MTLVTNPLVSIAIVTWNRREDVLLALESCYSQTYKNIEIVVVDNASADGTYKSLVEKYPEIKIVMTHRNLGCVPARNIAMANCEGDIIFCLDDDGVMDEQCIERVAMYHVENRDVALVACNVMSPDKKHEDIELGGKASKQGDVPVFIGAGFGIKREALDEIGYFPDYFRQGEENYLSLRILDKGYRMVFDPYAVVYHHWGYNEKGRNSREILYLNFRHELENIKRLLPFRHAIPILGYRIVVNLLRRYLKSDHLLCFVPDLLRALPVFFTDYGEEKIKIGTYKTFTKEASRFFRDDGNVPSN